MYGKDNLPATRYYAEDGIHLSTSGLRRLLDAINTSVNVVRDFKTCVFVNVPQSNRARNYGNNKNAPAGNLAVNAQSSVDRRYNRIRPRTNKYNKNSKRRCYECQMVGHTASESWNMNSQ